MALNTECGFGTTSTKYYLSRDRIRLFHSSFGLKGWIQVVRLKGNQMVNVKRFLASGGIGRGEAEPLSLAMSRKLHYSQEYGKCRMTLAKAAEEAGVIIWEMMACLRQKKIPAQYGLDDLKHDLDGILSRRRRKLPASKI